MVNRKIRISMLTIVMLLSIFACALCLGSNHSSALAAGEGKNKAVEFGNLGNATVGDILRFEITYNGYVKLADGITAAHNVKLVGIDSSVDPSSTFTSTSTTAIMAWIDGKRLNGEAYTDCEIGINFASKSGSNISDARMYVNDAFVFSHGKYSFKNPKAADAAQYDSLPKISPFGFKANSGYTGSVLKIENGATVTIASPFVFEGYRDSSASIITIVEGGVFTVDCDKEGYHEGSYGDYIGGVFGGGTQKYPSIDNQGTINYNNTEANAFKFGDSYSTSIKNSGTLNITGQIVLPDASKYTTFADKIQVEATSVINLNNLPAKVPGYFAFLNLNFAQTPDTLVGKTIINCDSASADIIRANSSAVKLFFNGGSNSNYALQVDGVTGKIIYNKKYNNTFGILGKDNRYSLTRQYTQIVGGDGTTYSEKALTDKSFAEIIAFVKANKTATPTIHFGDMRFNDLNNFSYSVANDTITIDFDCIMNGNLFFLGTDGNSPVIKFASGYTVTSYANFYFGVGDGMTGSITDATRNSCGYMQNEGTFIIRQGKYQTGSIDANGIFTRYNKNDLLLIKNSGTIQIDFLEDKDKYLKIFGYIERSDAAAIVEIKNQGDYNDIYGITQTDPIKVLVPYGTPIKDITPFAIGEGIQKFPYPTNFNTYNKIYVATSSTEKVYFSSTYEPKVTTGSDGNITAGKTIHYTTENNVGGSIIGDPTAPEEFALGTTKTLSIKDIIYDDGVAYVYAGMYINGIEYSVGKIIGTEFTTSEDFVITFYYRTATFDNKFKVKKATDGKIEFYAHVQYQDITSAFRYDYFLVCSESSFANAFKVLPILKDTTKPIKLIFDGYTDPIDLDLSYSENKKVALSGTIDGAVTIHYPLYCFRTLDKKVAITLGGDFSGDILVYNATNFISTDMYIFTLSGGYGTTTDSDGNIVKGIWTEDYTSYRISKTSGGNTFDYAVKEIFDAGGLITRYKVLSNVADVNAALKAIKDLNNANNGGGVHTIYLGEGTNGITAPDKNLVEFHNNAILQGKISTEINIFRIAANATVVFDSLELGENVNVSTGATLKLQGATLLGSDGLKTIYIVGAGAMVEDVNLTIIKKVRVAVDYDLALGDMFVKTDNMKNFTIENITFGQLNALKTGIYKDTGTKGYYIGLVVPDLLLKSEGITSGKVAFGDTWSITARPIISGLISSHNFTYSWEYSVGGGSRIKLTNQGATISNAINLTVGKYHTFYCKATFTFEGTTSTSTEMKVSFTATKKAITVGAPTYSGAELAFGESLTNASLVNYSFSQYGSYKFVDGQTAQGGTHAYNWIFVPNPDLSANYEFGNVTGTIELTAADRVYCFNYVIEQTGGTFTITDFNADKGIHVTVAKGLSFVSNGVMKAIIADIKEGIAAAGSTPTQINIKFGDGINAIAQDGSFEIPEGDTFNYLISGKTEYPASGVAVVHRGNGTLTTTADISSSGWAISNKESGIVKIIGGTITSSGNTTVYNEGSGTVSLNGGTVHYTGNEYNNYGISSGSNSYNSQIQLHSGKVISDNTYAVSVFRNVTLFGDVTLTSAANKAQFYVGSGKSLTVDSSYTTINNQYTLHLETVASGSIAVHGTTDTAHFAVMNDGYEFAADTANNQLNVIKSRTYYYNYTITKDGSDFVITDTSPDGTDTTEVYCGTDTALGTKIDNDRKNADNTYNDCTITFGKDGAVLDLGSIIFYCQNGNYLVKGSVTSAGESTVKAQSSAKVTIDADINNTNEGNGSAIGMSGNSNVTIIGGTIRATKRAIYHGGIGLLTVSQEAGKTTLITSSTEGLATDGKEPGTIYIMYNSSQTNYQLFSMTGGKVENTNLTSGVAIIKQCPGAISISGGEISAISTALYVSALGETTISGGTFTSDSTEKTIIANDDNLTISGGTITQNGTGYAVWFFGGQSVSKQLSITDCPSINGIIFVRRGINGAGYTGGLVKIDFTKWMIQDGAVVVYGSTDSSKWELTTPGYSPALYSSNGNLIAKASVKVTFDMGGVLDNSEQSVNVGSKITMPTSPTAIGFEFGGWYADAGYSSRFDFNTTVTNATTIYAKWTLGFADVSSKFVETTYDGKAHDLTVVFNTQNDKITYTYQWYLDGKIVSGWTTQSVSYINATSATEYTCVVTATFGSKFTRTSVNYIVIVNKAVLTVTANDQTIKFGEPISQTSYTISGFLGADIISNPNITGTPTLTANATTVAYGNTIYIDVSGMSTSNYTFVGENGTLKIEKADYTSAPAHPELTGTYTKNNTLANYTLNADFWWKTPDEKPTVALTAYEAYYNADPANYNDFSVSILLKLSKQKITVPTINSKVYNGLTQTADLTANGYTVTANSGGKDARADYVVTLTLEDFLNTEWDAATGLSGTNNEILTLSFEITQRAITVTIADQRSAQGNDLVDLTTALNAWQITVGSLVAGDNLGIMLSTEAHKNTIAVTAITGTAANKNYQVAFLNGKYSVYSVAGFNDFMTDYGATIVLTPGEITYAQVDGIISMNSAYGALDEDSLSQLTKEQKDNIAALKTKADYIIKAKTAAETALNALNGFTAEDIRADGISTWKQKITDAEQAVAAYTQFSTGLSSADLDGYANIAAAKTLTDNYDSALIEANTALAALTDKTAQGIVDATYTRADLQTLVDTAKEKKEAFYASGGTAENLSNLAEIARVEEELRVYDGYAAFVAAHKTTWQIPLQDMTLADGAKVTALQAAYEALSVVIKVLLTADETTAIEAVIEKSTQISTHKDAADAALGELDGITAEGLRNGTFDLGETESAIAAAKSAAKSYTDLSSGVTTADLANYGNIAAAEKAVADCKAYKVFADSHGEVYDKDPTKLTYPEALEVSGMYAAYLLLTGDVKNVLTEEESANIAALKEKADALIEKKELADEALDALNSALTGGSDKETLQDLLTDALNKTESFFSENGTTQDLAEYAALQNSKDKISEYEKQEFENQVNEDLGTIEDFTPEAIGGMDIPSLEDTIDKVQNAIDKIDASSDKTKEELKDKHEELSEIKDNLTQKLNLENTKVAAINELKAEREQLLASSAYLSSAKKEIAEYYANAIETIALATDLSAIVEHKDACIEEMNSVEILHVGLLVANLSFAVLLIGEILFLIFRKKIMHKKKDTKAYSSALPLVLLAAASGKGLTVGVTFLVILIIAVVVLGIYIAGKVLREFKGKTVFSPLTDKVDELVKKGADGAKKLFSKKAAEKAITADLAADAATVAVESPVSEADTATVVISGAEAEAPQNIHPSLPSEYSTDGSNSDETADVIDDEEETEVFRGIEAHTGLAILVRYKKSFLAKLIQSPDNTKRYYSELKNALLSFNKVTSRISWTYDSINLGRTKLAKLNVRGKTLCLYLALEPDDFAETKYKVERTESKKYEATPCLYKIKNVRRATYALDLIAKLGSAFGLTSGEPQNVDYVSEVPYDTTESLITREFIKELITKENYEAYLKRQQQQELEGKKREFVSASEVSNILSDEVAAALVETRHTKNLSLKAAQAVPRGKRGIINIDKISEAFGAGDTVTLSALQGKSLLSKSVNHVKVLARGALNKPLTVEANEFSIEAVKMILLTGGKVIKIKD